MNKEEKEFRNLLNRFCNRIKFFNSIAITEIETARLKELGKQYGNKIKFHY
jgi:hypothetical protein